MKPCSPSRVRRYKGIHKPRCNKGVGCEPCWTKWREAHPLTFGEWKKDVPAPTRKQKEAFDKRYPGMSGIVLSFFMRPCVFCGLDESKRLYQLIYRDENTGKYHRTTETALNIARTSSNTFLGYI
tara:strand:+ start:291 stop:665 length:375 start_codon:yes stop_codon:yes gene_type:complete